MILKGEKKGSARQDNARRKGGKPDRGSPSGKRALGIGPRLFLAFGVVVALILLACATALLSGRSVTHSFSVATDRSVPAMTEALALQSDAASMAAAAPLLAAAQTEDERRRRLEHLNRQWAALEAGVDRLEGLGVSADRIASIRSSITSLAGSTGNLNRAVTQQLEMDALLAERRQEIEATHADLLDSTQKLAESAGTKISVTGVGTSMKVADDIKRLFEKDVPQLRRALEASSSVERLAKLLFQAAAAGNTGDLSRTVELFEAEMAALQELLPTLPQGDWTQPLADAVAHLQTLGSGPDGIFETRRRILAVPGALGEGAASDLAALQDEVEAAAQGGEELLVPMVEQTEADLAANGKETAARGSEAIRGLVDQGVRSLQGVLSLKAEANGMTGLLGQAMTANSLDTLKQLRSDFGTSSALSAMALVRAQEIRDQLEPKRAALQAFGEAEGNIFDLRSHQIAAAEEAQAALAASRTAADQLGKQVTAMVGEVRGDLEESTTSVADALGRSEILQLAIAGSGLLISVLIAWLYVGRNLVGRLQSLAGSMREIAGGDLTANVPVGGRDEIAQMADALLVFRDGLASAEAERNRNEAEREEAQRHRREEMLELAEGFESSVKGVVESVSTSASEMQSTAETMSGTADHASGRASAVASASEETSGNVQSAASAARQLANSITEISRQVSHSTTIAQDASNKAEETNVQVEGLSAAAQKIGEVVNLISEIAEQTNLLALNATIEAARAGEAGRGFAVVASEVKNLASQTAKATEEIAAQIGGMQSATGEAVGAIRSIGEVIAQMSEIATSISAAVEEQGAATEEIAATMGRAAEGTQSVATNITGVTEAAKETGAASSQVLEAAGELARNAETLSAQVDRFLERIRAA